MLGDLRAVPRGGRLPAAPRERAVLSGGSSQVPLMALTEGSVADSRLAGNRHRQEFRAEDVQAQSHLNLTQKRHLCCCWGGEECTCRVSPLTLPSSPNQLLSIGDHCF